MNQTNTGRDRDTKPNGGMSSSPVAAHPFTLRSDAMTAKEKKDIDDARSSNGNVEFARNYTASDVMECGVCAAAYGFVVATRDGAFIEFIGGVQSCQLRGLVQPLVDAVLRYAETRTEQHWENLTYLIGICVRYLPELITCIRNLDDSIEITRSNIGRIVEAYYRTDFNAL